MLSPFTNRCVYFRCIYGSPIWFNHLSYDGVLRWLVWLDLWKSEVSPNTNLNMCYVFFFCYRNGAKCQSHWNNRKQKVKCNEDVNFWYTSNWRRVKKITKVAIWTGFPEKSNLFEREELTRKERLKLRSGPIFRFFFLLWQKFGTWNEINNNKTIRKIVHSTNESIARHLKSDNVSMTLDYVIFISIFALLRPILLNTMFLAGSSCAINIQF